MTLICGSRTIDSSVRGIRHACFCEVSGRLGLTRTFYSVDDCLFSLAPIENLIHRAIVGYFLAVAP